MASSHRLDLGQSTPPKPDKATGTIAAALTVVAFAVAHDLWIVDIWFNIVPMVISGSVCGLSIVWGYQHAVEEHSWARWLGYNTLLASLVVGLGGASLLVFEPRFTMTELMVADDALGQVLPPAMPLIGIGAVAGALIVWTGYGRKLSALLPMLVTQGLLMFLVGHQLAILGLVEIPTDQLYLIVEFIGATFFLAGGFAFSAMVLTMVRRKGSESRSAANVW